MGTASYLVWRPEAAESIVGIVRATEIRVAPEVGGQLVALKARKGASVHAGDVVAELSAIELTAAVTQARATLNAAISSRDHVYAGVRAEQMASLAAEIAKAQSRRAYAQAQLGRAAYLADGKIAAKQTLDQAESDEATARADIDEARANYAAAQAGPTEQERAIADAQVKAAATALAVLERRLEKTALTAPADGVISVIVAEIGENIRAGQPVLVIAQSGKQWLSFNVREDQLHGLTVGSRVRIVHGGGHEPGAGLGHRLVRLQLGRPSARWALTIATRCACASIRREIRPRLMPERRPGDR